jgi:hypothetical protein
MDDNRAQSLETPQDAGKGAAGVVSRWLLELELASKEEEGWRKAAKETVERYRDEERRQRQDRKGKSRFNILWSNTEIQRPSLYSNTPRPDIRRRRNQSDQAQDKLMRSVAEGLERAAAYTVDESDLDQYMEYAVLDYLLGGRPITRVRYKPTTGEDDTIVWERVEFEHVQWDRFRRGPGGVWDDVNWIAFEHLMTREELRKLAPEAAERVELDVTNEGAEKLGDEADLFKRGRVWEIWDKAERKVLYIAPSVKDAPLREDDDPLKLKRFYPIPRPLYYTQTTDTLVPIEADRQYRDQRDELDQITHRIRRITSALKVRGIYDATLNEVQRVLEGDDNEFIPSEGAQNILAQTGTLDRHIWTLPIGDFAAALAQLYIQRDQIKQTIYEITGLSDILRGASDANETLGAQQLKAQTGSLRLQKRQRDVQRYARDLIEMACEIMAEHFQADTLSIMVGEPVDEQVLSILRQQGLRDFSINVETDSTISVDQSQDQEAVTTLLEGITRYMTAVAPAVQSGLFPADAAKALLISAVRRFRLGREVEETLEGDGGNDIDPMVMQQIQQQAMQQAMQQAEQAVADESAKIQQERAQVEQTKAGIEAEAQKVQMSAEQAREAQNMQTKALELERREALTEIKSALQQLEDRKMRVEELENRVSASIEDTSVRDETLTRESSRLDAFHEQMGQLSEAMTGLAESVARSMEIQAQSNQQVLAALTAEKEIVRDKQGRAIGAKLKLVS